MADQSLRRRAFNVFFSNGKITFCTNIEEDVPWGLFVIRYANPQNLRPALDFVVKPANCYSRPSEEKNGRKFLGLHFRSYGSCAST